jgi:ferredoxin
MTEHIDIKLLTKEQVNAWLKGLQDYDIFGPVKRENYSEFAKLENIEDLNLALPNTFVSPKRLLFQQSKAMFQYNLNRTPPELAETIEETIEERTISKAPKNQIIFGIRPCDVHGILAFDPTFDSEFNDPYYLKMREVTTLIGIACNEPDVNCFCTSMDSGPFDEAGMDILMIDIGSDFLVKIFTEKGSTLINIDPNLFSEPEKNSIDKLSELKERSQSGFVRTLDKDGKPAKLGQIFESVYWDDISKKCLGCGICTFLCPTCYCFDITDEKWGSSGERVRTWDSCMFPEYTVHASGYNPRPARMNRLRNRFYHKFKYYPDLHDIYGCTGCGRCIRHCPVNVDIIDIINGVSNVAEEGDVQ